MSVYFAGNLVPSSAPQLIRKICSALNASNIFVYCLVLSNSGLCSISLHSFAVNHARS